MLPRRYPKRQGELAEAAFIHKALELGFRISKPFGDSDTYDFILDNGQQLFRIQVKTSSTPRGLKYDVPVSRCNHKMPYRAGEVDFFAIYIPPCGAWYIVPFRAIQGKMSASVFPEKPNSRGRLEIYREAWHLLRRDTTLRRID